MHKTTQHTKRLAQAQDFIWRNARLVDRYFFACLFEDGSPDLLIRALKAYQNVDGGFGNALEPDKRVPASQPIDVETALIILELAGLLADPDVGAQLLRPACDFLQTITTPEGGVPFSLPSARNYPHAPWWGVDDDPEAALNPTAGIAGRLIKAGLEHPWVERATDYCWRAIAATETREFHDLMPVLSFLENVPDRARARKELDRLAERIRVPGVVEMDPDAAGYVKMPLDWAPTPQSFCFGLFERNTLDTHLAALAGRQQADGGWPISWDPLSPGIELEWRGHRTVLTLYTLRAYEHAGFSIPV